MSLPPMVRAGAIRIDRLGYITSKDCFGETRRFCGLSSVKVGHFAMSALRPFIPQSRICGLATINLCSNIGLFRAFVFPQKPSGKHRGNILG